MSKWNETGILRKTSANKDNYEDLLVFGYACKLFRDDEKALYIDQGKHLIPWMTDDKLKIDRYDGRGALSDLSCCEASKEGFDAMRWLGLSETERKLEQLCDDERFYSLLMNEEEEAYKEEAQKRLKANEFHYSYDVPRDPEAENSNSQDSSSLEEDSVPYVAPTDLDVPVDINIPKTVKESARIEKTALFVSKQGPQMEILIKAKQSDNAQFNFMSQSDSLYKFYRHVLSAIKNGRYKTQAQQEAEIKEAEAREAANLAAEAEHYLHPTLAQPPHLQPPPVVPRLAPLPYKPAANCAYTQLISRIQGNGPVVDAPPSPVAEPAAPQPQATAAQQTSEQQQQYYQYYYNMQYYEYYKQITQQYAAQAGCDPQTIVQNHQLQGQIQSQAGIYAQNACTQYMQQNNAQIAENVPAAAPLPAEPCAKPVETASKPAESSTNSLQSLVHYSSDSEDEEEETIAPVQASKVTFKVPPAETATIIDKMAAYVSKNGADFESIVRAKADTRFEFLFDTHDFYQYYKHKLNEYLQDAKIAQDKNSEKVAKTTITKEKKIITPVSFSLKKPKDEKEIKSALPLEESDEEGVSGEATPQTIAAITPPLDLVATNQLNELQPVVANIDTPLIATLEAVVQLEEGLGEVATPAVEDLNEVVGDTNGIIQEDDDPILEMIDLTDDLEERRDAKRAEDKIKDKLAMAAKEKLSSSKSRDRALQMERRKKAAMFIKLKSVENHPVIVDLEQRTVTKSSRKDGRKASSDCENRKCDDRVAHRKDVILKIDDSETEEEGEIRRQRSRSKASKSVKKAKKSHKRKSSRSRSRYESKSSHHTKRSKKHKKRTSSQSSANSS